MVDRDVDAHMWESFAQASAWGNRAKESQLTREKGLAEHKILGPKSWHATPRRRTKPQS